MGDGNVRLDRLNSGAPLLDTHSSEALANVIGMRRCRQRATSRMAEASQPSSFVPPSSDADTVSKIREGVIRILALATSSTAARASKARAASLTLSRSAIGNLLEVSAVPIPADPGAQIRKLVAAQDSRRRDRERRFRNGAAEATRLLQSTQTTRPGSRRQRSAQSARHDWPNGASRQGRQDRQARGRKAAPARPANCCASHDRAS